MNFLTHFVQLWSMQTSLVSACSAFTPRIKSASQSASEDSQRLQCIALPIEKGPCVRAALLQMLKGLAANAESAPLSGHRVWTRSD